MAEQVTPPDVLGTAEAAEALSVEVPRITRWRKSGKMPAPAAELAATAVWHRGDVEALREGRVTSGGPLDLVSTSEAAKILKVDKSQIGRWRRAGEFPEPCKVLAAGPLWWRRDIRRFTPPAKRRRTAV